MLERHLDMIKTYTQASDYISCHIESGSYYKKSALKSKADIEFLPVNFHVQRLSVRNVSTKKRKRSSASLFHPAHLTLIELSSTDNVYDVFTVGAFTAISRKSKNGALFSMLSHFSKSPSFNG